MFAIWAEPTHACVCPGSRPRRSNRILGLALRGIRLPHGTVPRGSFIMRPENSSINRDRRQSGISLGQIVPSDAIHPFCCHAKARRSDCVSLHDERPISHRPLTYKSEICFCTLPQGCYSSNMNVAATEFRAQLRHWLDCARAGEEVVITERGVPVARLSGIDSTPMIERLTAQGVISAPKSSERPRAADQQLPRPRVPLSELVSDQRR